MSAVAELKSTKSAELAKNEVQIYGKITGVRGETTKDKRKLYFTLVRLPSSGDEFEAPGTVEVMSEQKFGAVGDIVTARCRLSGYGRRYNKKPDDDGVIESVQTADIKLRLVE